MGSTPRNKRQVCCCDVLTTAVDGPSRPSQTRPFCRVSIAHIVLLLGPHAICCAPAADTSGPVGIHRARAVKGNSHRYNRRCTSPDPPYL